MTGTTTLSAASAGELFQLSGNLPDRRIVVAMSGGVDSSVVAALAAHSGAEVIGVTLQLYDYGAATGRKGPAVPATTSAMRARSPTGWESRTMSFDHESRFREEVVERFADDYLAGKTPIPCIRCNMGPKFTDLLAMARDLGADCLATGHYVRRVEGAWGPELHRALDPARDQSYFLYGTTEAQLDFLRFPLGRPAQARRRARWPIRSASRLPPSPTARTSASCPMATTPGSWRDSSRRRRCPGEIVHAQSGEVLGEHRGVIHYTVGQRRGLEIGGLKEPLYVTGIDAPARRVLVGPRAMLAVQSARIVETNRIGSLPGEPLTAKVRSLAKPVAGHARRPVGRRRKHDPALCPA
jgi:tRNA-specific 2-thiouridylase